MILNAVIDPKIRGKGYGKTFIGMLAEEAKRKNKKLLATTFNNEELVDIFGRKGFGFEIAEVIKGDGEILWEYPSDPNAKREFDT